MPAEDIKIRPVTLNDVPQITEIVNHYITNTVVNYSLHPISQDYYSQIISSCQKEKLPFFVAVPATSTPSSSIPDASAQEKISGFTLVSPYKPTKLGYSHSVELSIYLSAIAPKNTGLGTTLLATLIKHLEENTFLTFSEDPKPGEELEIKAKQIVAMVAVDAVNTEIDEQVNAFYLKNGFKQTAYTPGVGWKFGRPQDVRFMQLEINKDYIPGGIYL